MNTINYKWARENYDLHRALQEIEKIPARINPAGKLYRKLIREIRNKYNVNI